MALLVALCAALGYLLAGVPNVELVSVAIFTSGALEGPRRGAVIGLLAEGLYAGLNPNGVSPPPLYLAQVTSMAAIGAAGGSVGPLLRRCRAVAQAIAAALSGLGLTLAYDVLTNSAIWLAARESASWLAIIVGGLSFPFPLAHALGNTAVFALLVPAVLGAVRRRSAP
jgi:hypothetical protein